MAFKTLMKCVILLLLVTCIGHSYAEDKSVPQLSYNELKNREEIEANTQDAKTLEDTLGLESILGRDWKTENKPLSDEEINSIFKDFFGSDGTNEDELSTQSNSKPNNPKDIKTVLDPQIDEQARNNENNRKDVIQNSKASKEDRKQATFISSDTSYLQGTNNLGSTISVLQPKIEIGIYAATTPSDGLENINPYTIWPSIADDHIPTSPSFKINTPKYQNELSQTLDTQTIFPIFSSDFLPDSQSGVLPPGPIIQAGIYTTTTPSNWYGSQENTLRSDVADDVNTTDSSLTSDTYDEEHSTVTNFVPENQPVVKPTVPDLKSINSTYESFRPDNQSDIIVTVPIDLNPHIPKYNPNVLIRPVPRYRHHSHIRPHRPHFWVYGSNFGHGGHTFTKLRHRNNHWFGRHGHNLQRYRPTPPGLNLSNNYRQPGQPWFKMQNQNFFNHYNGDRYRDHHRYHPGFHGNYHNSFIYR